MLEPTVSVPARLPEVVVPYSPLVVARDARASAPDFLRSGFSGAAVTDQSFPRSARLINGKAYSAVFKKNQRFGDRYWTVLVHRSQFSDGCGRLGLAVAKKRAKRAVDRNRIKRVAREQFRLHRHALTGIDLVIMNRDPATTASAKQLGGSLQVLIGKILARESKIGARDGSSSLDKGAQRAG